MGSIPIERACYWVLWFFGSKEHTGFFGGSATLSRTVHLRTWLSID